MLLISGGSTIDAVAELGPTAPQRTLLDRFSGWKYDDTGTDLGTAWRSVDFDDAGWAFGPAQLGFGDGDEAEVAGADFRDRRQFHEGPPQVLGIHRWTEKDAVSGALAVDPIGPVIELQGGRTVLAEDWPAVTPFPRNASRDSRAS